MRRTRARCHPHTHTQSSFPRTRESRAFAFSFFLDAGPEPGMTTERDTDGHLGFMKSNVLSVFLYGRA